MRLKEMLDKVRCSLREAGFESYELEGAWILSRACGVPHLELPLHGREELRPERSASAEAMLARRLAHEPLQYILGDAQFRELLLKVGPGVLVPRMETEELVDHVKRLLPSGGAFCEIGVGSGAISLAVALERLDASVCGSELSPEAMKWAELNKKELGASRVRFLLGDMLAPFEGERFDVVAANLPYIADGERPSLPRDVREHEPASALFSGPEGLDAIRRAVSEAPRFLKPGGHLLLETGESQGLAIGALIASDGRYSGSRVLKDLFGMDRFVEASLRLVCG